MLSEYTQQADENCEKAGTLDERTDDDGDKLVLARILRLASTGLKG